VRPDLPSGTVTFLFTDVEGSTRLLHELGAAAYAEALAEHRRVLREAFARHGGVEMDTQGDAFFYAFPDAAEALQAADQGRQALDSGPIRVRIGLHTGSPHVTEEGYVGEDVHLGARIAASAHGGQVVCSGETAVRADLELTDLGEHRLKDIEAAVSIYQLGEERFPPLKTISNTNLPRPASSFVGRERESEEVVSLLKDGARLLTLSGPGGSGKTRLAIEAASELVPDFKSGVFWVGLAALTDPALVTETIAQTLGAKDGLDEHIQEREMLLLLDNLEQVVESAPELASLVEACPNLKLLCTSRELLRVRGEVEYAVPPLTDSEAVELFCQRSQLEADGTIADLCRRLDNLPLAVELAAARTSVLTPKQILERLSQRLDLLKGGRGAEARQQTLRATVEWSFDLLSEEEQQLFRRLSVFAGGCTLEAAEQVAEADLDTLQSLVEKSLLRFTNGCYWMLETIREFASERIRETREAESLHRLHARHYTHVAEAAAPNLRRGGEQATWLARLEDEYGNLRVALDWLAGADEAEWYLTLAATLANFWVVRGYATEGRAHLERALELAPARDLRRSKALQGAIDLAEIQGDDARSAQLAEELLDLARDLGDPATESLALRCLANAALGNDDFEAAERLYGESLEIARRLDDQRTLPGTLGNLGNLFLRRGDLGRARPLFEESISLAIQLEGNDSVVVGLMNLGTIAFLQGDHEEAFKRFSEGTKLAHEIGFKEGLVYGLEGLAWVAAERRNPEPAARLLGAAARIRDGLGAELEALERTYTIKQYFAFVPTWTRRVGRQPGRRARPSAKTTRSLTRRGS
jgi:predicted ATPase